MASVNYPRDYTVVDWYEHQSDHAFNSASWYVYTDGGQKIQFSVPQLPKAITDAYPSLKERMQDLPWKAITLRSRDDITSFKDFVAGFYKRETVYSYKTSERIKIYNNENENARRAIQELPQRVQDELKEHEARR